MSKTYIVSRNGGTVTKAPINDNKIPIYDSEQDVKADINNMSEDQLYGYPEPKFDIDDMKQYIRNQNVLSDYETITISHNSSNPTEMRYDGFITLRSTINFILYMPSQSALGGTGYTQVFSVWSNTQTNWATITVPVKKGDLLYVDVGNLTNQAGRFYKLRDYSDR